MRENQVVQYSARVIETIDTPGPEWGLRVGVFRHDGSAEEQIGEYHRNYHELFDTFWPFQVDGRDFALYSPNYTATRVMELPSCVDIGGEEPDGEGFCPTDFYVPSYVEYGSFTSPNAKPLKVRINEPGDDLLAARSTSSTEPAPAAGESVGGSALFRPVSPRLYYPFGFVAGCLWGEDSSWNVEYLDLSEAHNGSVRRDQRFGLIEMPNHLRLHEAIDMCDYMHDGECTNIRITVVRAFDCETGLDLTPEG